MTARDSDGAVVLGLRAGADDLIEWYDWYAYAAFSIYFASVFCLDTFNAGVPDDADPQYETHLCTENPPKYVGIARRKAMVTGVDGLAHPRQSLAK
jgi:hypothetical protein